MSPTEVAERCAPQIRKTLYIHPVFCEVITLRKDGLRLRPEEWPAPLRGKLQVKQQEGRALAARRSLREVQLVGEWVIAPMVLAFMFEPEFIDVVGDGFLLRGNVIQSVEGRCYEHQQLWLVRPTSESDPPLPPFDARPFRKNLPIEERSGNEPSTSEQWLAAHPDAATWKR